MSVKVLWAIKADLIMLKRGRIRKKKKNKMLHRPIRPMTVFEKERLKKIDKGRLFSPFLTGLAALKGYVNACTRPGFLFFCLDIIGISQQVKNVTR